MFSLIAFLLVPLERGIISPYGACYDARVSHAWAFLFHAYVRAYAHDARVSFSCCALSSCVPYNFFPNHLR
jgi:hypothetical protein